MARRKVRRMKGLQPAVETLYFRTPTVAAGQIGTFLLGFKSSCQFWLIVDFIVKGLIGLLADSNSLDQRPPTLLLANCQPHGFCPMLG